jgi:hypothetical protein
MKGWGITCFALLLVACDSDLARPQTEQSQNSAIPLRSPEDRAFDAKLWANHKEWMGTPWTFTGTSQTPRQGSIACGYFVTTTLQQVGVTLDRVRLAQAASEKMILATTDPASVRRYSDASLESFLEGLRSQGEGYYIVGLDNHTGFLKVAPDGEVTFIHSGPGRGVVVEVPAEATELATSRYRVTGKLFKPAPPESTTAGSSDPVGE